MKRTNVIIFRQLPGFAPAFHGVFKIDEDTAKEDGIDDIPAAVAEEVNRVTEEFCKRNPEFYEAKFFHVGVMDDLVPLVTL